MVLKYTKEKLDSFDKETLIQLFLSQQEQLENIDHTLQLVLEQVADLKRHRFGRSSERHETAEQISFMEVNGEIVFFNEAEAVAGGDSGRAEDAAPRKRPQKKKGKREEDLEGLPIVVVEHSMTDGELEELFGTEGWKQLPDEVYRRYGFTPAKVEVEEHHVKVYAGKKTDEIIRAPHPESLLKGSLVSPSLEAAVMNAKYVNAVPLYRQEQEFERYGLHVSRQNMANWTIQCADRYLAVLYDYLHEKMYGCHVLQADETPLLVNKDGRPAGSKSYMWVYRTGQMYKVEPSPCLALLRHKGNIFFCPCEVSLHQRPDTQLAALSPFFCREFLQQFFFPVDRLDHCQRKVCTAVFPFCFWQCLYCFVKTASCMGPASGNLQVFPPIFHRVVDLIPVCDAYPAEILQEYPSSMPHGMWRVIISEHFRILLFCLLNVLGVYFLNTGN